MISLNLRMKISWLPYYNTHKLRSIIKPEFFSFMPFCFAFLFFFFFFASLDDLIPTSMTLIYDWLSWRLCLDVDKRCFILGWHWLYPNQLDTHMYQGTTWATAGQDRNLPHSYLVSYLFAQRAWCNENKRWYMMQMNPLFEYEQSLLSTIVSRDGCLALIFQRLNCLVQLKRVHTI